VGVSGEKAVKNGLFQRHILVFGFFDQPEYSDEWKMAKTVLIGRSDGGGQGSLLNPFQARYGLQLNLENKQM
jgi:hypothetical protein